MVWLEALEMQEGMLTDVIQGRFLQIPEACPFAICATFLPGDQVSDTIRSFLPMWHPSLIQSNAKTTGLEGSIARLKAREETHCNSFANSACSHILFMLGA